MRVAQRGQVAPLQRPVTQRHNDAQQLRAQQREALAHHDKVGVVAHKARRSTQVNDGGGRGAHLLAKGVDVAHDVVADLALFGFGHVVVDVVAMCPHGLHVSCLDLRQPQLVLRLRQGGPEPP